MLKGKIILENGMESGFKLTDADVAMLEAEAKRIDSLPSGSIGYDMASELAFGVIRAGLRQMHRRQNVDTPGAATPRASR